MARIHAYDAAEGPKWEIYLSDSELSQLVERRRADFVRGRDLTVLPGSGHLAEVRVIIGEPTNQGSDV
ncbi:hypothetical protein [Kribbella solani]|uniref:hypothetical protein n=1 Tax=Kribbella solani TaxID=236067 RepID=UPI0029BE1CBC|nr:hypothetical protein [Kribbella solani]MDX2970974.1 hypothetical protein [Kribbella solani]